MTTRDRDGPGLDLALRVKALEALSLVRLSCQDTREGRI
jgi:hypothetical protein